MWPNHGVKGSGEKQAQQGACKCALQCISVIVFVYVMRGILVCVPTVYIHVITTHTHMVCGYCLCMCASCTHVESYHACVYVRMLVCIRYICNPCVYVRIVPMTLEQMCLCMYRVHIYDQSAYNLPCVCA